MNCGQCKHFETIGATIQGRCCAPAPACIDNEGLPYRRLVYAVEGNLGNYADDCESFMAKDLETP